MNYSRYFCIVSSELTHGVTLYDENKNRICESKVCELYELYLAVIVNMANYLLLINYIVIVFLRFGLINKVESMYQCTICTVVCDNVPYVQLYVTMYHMYSCMCQCTICTVVCDNVPYVQLYVSMYHMYSCM